MTEKSLETQGLRSVFDHLNRVQNHMATALANLAKRLANHDLSKLGQSEIDLVTGKPKLNSIEYMSDEYKEALENISTAVSAHYKANSHHPEHFEHWSEMTLFDLLEMVCDWKAASETNPNGGFSNSVAFGKDRHGFSDEMAQILKNTGHEMGWITSQE